mmetsp:Transcript_31077/g.61531  ORF Transcript_31077/g.61531 Transcript_31077/m.61531 type:complete len:83 (-) Transcript_31077:667-915(-)
MPPAAFLSSIATVCLFRVEAPTPHLRWRAWDVRRDNFFGLSDHARRGDAGASVAAASGPVPMLLVGWGEGGDAVDSFNINAF